jgi:predicted AAA+ superfamily ATPase
LHDFLIFGGYPAVVTAEKKDDKIGLLTELVDSYLLRDVLALERIKKSEVLLNLVKYYLFKLDS